VEVIVIESEAFQELKRDIESIQKQVKEIGREKSREQYLTSDQVADFLKVSKRTLQSYRDRRLVQFIQIGSKILYKIDQIEEFLSRHKVQKNL